MEHNFIENHNNEPETKLLEKQEELGLLEPEKKEEKVRSFSKINFEMILIILLGFLIGVVIKTEASRRFTIGYEDYQVAQNKQAYDIEKIEKDLFQKTKDENGSGTVNE
jgi:hypothetical protein